MASSDGSFTARNIVLDFLDRANREMYHLYDNALENIHIDYLVEALTVAAFLCGEFCITPPGPIAECHLARGALIRRAAYLDEGLIRFPLRETTVDEFIAKKQREYRPHQTAFVGLYETTSVQFFKRFAVALIRRSTQVGRTLAERLEAGPDVDDIWKPILKQLSSSQIEATRRIGNQLLENGLAITWKALSAHLPDQGRGLELLRIALQHYYFTTYMAEYGATVLRNVPFANIDLGLTSSSLRYDFAALRLTLRTCRLWNTVRYLSAESVLQLRTGAGYARFRAGFDELCRRCTKMAEFKEGLVGAASGFSFTAVQISGLTGMWKAKGLRPERG
jgi:hypothetical protein